MQITKEWLEGEIARLARQADHALIVHHQNLGAKAILVDVLNRLNEPAMAPPDNRPEESA